MGLWNRPYWRNSGGEPGGPGSVRMGFRLYLPRPRRAVIGLMAACAVVFLLPLFVDGKVLEKWLVLLAGRPLDAWRFLSFQFVHAGPGHIFMNLMGLYFFGPPLEERWGAWRFLLFYLACGVAAGGAFILLALATRTGGASLVGASGGVLACVAACAVLMPEMNILLIPIRWATGILLAVCLLNVGAELLGKVEAGVSDAAHLGGMMAGGVWALLRRWPWRPGRGLGGLRSRLRRGAWRRRQEAQARRQAEVDRILGKVHSEGIASLTERERKTLAQETERLRERGGH